MIKSLVKTSCKEGIDGAAPLRVTAIAAAQAAILRASFAFLPCKREPSKNLLGSVCFKREFFPFTAQAFSGRLLSQKRKGKRKKRRKRLGSGRGKAGNRRESGQGGVLTILLR